MRLSGPYLIRRWGGGVSRGGSSSLKAVRNRQKRSPKVASLLSWEVQGRSSRGPTHEGAAFSGSIS